MNLKEYGVKPSDNDQEDSRQEDKDNPGVLESNEDSGVEWVKSAPFEIPKSDRVKLAGRQEKTSERWQQKVRVLLTNIKKVGPLSLISTKVEQA